MPRPIHFEIHMSDPTRAIPFYEGLFGWRITKWDGPMPYWIVDTATAGRPDEPGIHGGMVQRMGDAPVEGAAVNAWVCTVGVDAVDASVTDAQRLGGTVTVPKMAVPGIGWLAYVKDPDGNILGLMQSDAAAK